jgi:hypothetical protein
MFPAWHLGRNPDHRIILASYGASLARKNSRYARNVVQLNRYRAVFPGVELADDSHAVDAWDIKGREGGLDALGVGGGVAGKGGNIIIIDDPVKSRVEAESKVYRDRTWDWFNDDLYTRREPGAATIAVMTRWHQDDLVGRLLKKQPGRWEMLNLPALAEGDDPLGREEGAALWPWRYPIEELDEIRYRLGMYAFASLYQQRPVPREGGLFKWKDIEDNRVTDLPELKRIVVAVDPSGGSKDTSDETGIIVAGLDHSDHGYILEDLTGRYTPEQWAYKAIAAYHRWKADRVIGEANNGGEMIRAVVQSIDSAVAYKDVFATKGKTLRAEPISVFYEQGRVHHHGEFLQLEDQMTTWQHGDASPNNLDAAVWALTELKGKPGLSFGWA